MADEEKLQKRVEFIIEQQAQFAANQQRVEERVTKVEDLLGRLIVVTTAGFKELTEKVSVVIDAQIRTEENVSGLAEKVAGLARRMTELAVSQEHTDQRLNAMIDIIHEGRNGQSQN